MISQGVSLRIVDTALDPESKERVIYYRMKEGRTLYRVWIYLEGRGLPFVDRVTYGLHPTFEPRERTVPRTVSNPNCRLEIWTWGLFEVKAIVLAKNEQRFELKHQLSYDKQFEFEGVVSREWPA